ncbi:MAG: ArsA family ATPase [Acidimicrobiales bacterium]
MDPGRFFASSRVLIVAGKGGVGKTVTAATIASAASRSGRSVLLVEVAGRSASAPIFGVEPQGYEQVTAVDEAEHGDPPSGRIMLRSITPDQALVEWLTTHGFKGIVTRMASSGILEVVATATPGIKDLLVLGRIKALESEGAFDLIVVDAPAAGHALGFLRSPAGVRDAARTGTIHRQAVEVLELISDPARCQVVLVTIPEETPVNELIETSFAIEDEMGVRLGPVVVNSVLPTVDGLDVDLASLDVSDTERNALQMAVTFRVGRAALQDEQLARLGSELPLDQLRLPQLFSTTVGPDELAVLTDALLAEIEALPEVDS